MPADEAQPMFPPHSHSHLQSHPYPHSHLLHTPNMAEDVHGTYTWQGHGRQKKSKGANLPPGATLPYHHDIDMQAEQKHQAHQAHQAQQAQHQSAPYPPDLVPWHGTNSASAVGFSEGAASASESTESMSLEDKAKASRDRNREHARNTRLRKKVSASAGSAGCTSSEARNAR